MPPACLHVTFPDAGDALKEEDIAAMLPPAGIPVPHRAILPDVGHRSWQIVLPENELHALLIGWRLRIDASNQHIVHEKRTLCVQYAQSGQHPPITFDRRG